MCACDVSIATTALTLEQVLLCVHVRIVRDDVKGRSAGHHLKHQHAQGPPVHAEAWDQEHLLTTTISAQAPPPRPHSP